MRRGKNLQGKRFSAGRVPRWGRWTRSANPNVFPEPRDGARSRNRTGTELPPADFKSAASTDFAIRAGCGDRDSLRQPCATRHQERCPNHPGTVSLAPDNGDATHSTVPSGRVVNALADRVATACVPDPIPTLRLSNPRSGRGETAHCGYSLSSMRAGPGAACGQTRHARLHNCPNGSNRPRMRTEHGATSNRVPRNPLASVDSHETMAQKKRPGCPGRFSNWRPRSELNRRTRICSPLHNHSATRPVTCHSILPAAASACNRCKPSPEKTKPRGRGFVSEDDSVTGGPLIWSGKRDSNSRPRPWQGRALPTELFPLKEAIF